jgi:uncharacterized membrane protein YbhN (UPF0104 family)
MSGTLKTILRVAVSAGLIVWALHRAPLGEVGEALRSADARFVLAALALAPLGCWASVARWRLLIRSQGGDAPFGFLVRSFLVGVFFNNLLPSTIGGDTVRAIDTARSGVGRASAITIVVVDRFVGLLALMLFAGAGLLFSGRLVDRIPDLYGWVAGGAVVLGVVAAVLFLPSRLGERLPAVFAFQGKGLVLAKAFAYSLALQALVVLNAWLLAKALRVPIPLATFFLIVPFAVFLMMIPVSINAIGVRENVWAFFFAAFGIAASKAVALAWLDYGLVLLQAVAGGILYVLCSKVSPSPGEGGLGWTGRGGRGVRAARGVAP